jgi:CHAT domain-containing protein
MEQERTKALHKQRGAAIELYSAELSEAQRKYEALLDDERARNSAVVRAAAVPVASVTSALPPKSALLDYIVGSDCLNVFVITRQGIHGLTTPLRSNDLRTRVELLRKLIANPGSDEWKPVATGLYRILLGAAEQRGWLKDVTHLYVAPHDVLHYVPFAVLPRNDGRLAVENYTLTYVAAASSLAHDNSTTDSEGLLAVAPARPELVYAAAEARSASRAFPGHSALLIGHNATETSFKRMAPHYEILHLATHGFFNRVNPMFSAIELEPDAENDGRLEVFEILNLNLHARLVTLSACETAMGSGIWSEYPAGDEFLSVTRAFLDAGSESVLATLWKVEDASTASLMGRFYGSLDSMNGDAALASAQRSLLKDPRYRHPFYWGAFVLAARGSETNEKLAKKR